jgi:hypothetical protein
MPTLKASTFPSKLLQPLPAFTMSPPKALLEPAFGKVARMVAMDWGELWGATVFRGAPEPHHSPAMASQHCHSS